MLDICLPIYDRIEAKTFASLMSVEMPKSKISFSIVEEEPDIVTARNKLCSNLVNELSLWIDSDIIFPQDAILKMAVVMGDESIGVVSGVYRGRTFPNEVTLFKWAVIEGQSGLVSGYESGSEVPYEVAACGAGFMMVRNKVFREGCNFGRVGKYSEDISFCMRVKDLGYRIFAHPGIKCGHVAKMVLEV